MEINVLFHNSGQFKAFSLSAYAWRAGRRISRDFHVIGRECMLDTGIVNTAISDWTLLSKFSTLILANHNNKKTWNLGQFY